jgi:hypothetical protein
MGVFVAFSKMLYAVHVPNNHFELAAVKFAQFIKQSAPNFDGRQAKLFIALNGNARNNGDNEFKKYAQLLNIKEFSAIRIMRPVDYHLGSPKAIVVVAEYLPKTTKANGNTVPSGEFTDSVVIKFKMDKDVVWIKNFGQAASGKYRTWAADDLRLSTNINDPSWTLANQQTSDIDLLKA